MRKNINIFCCIQFYISDEMRVKIKFENEFLQLTFTIIIIYRHMFVYAQFDVRAQYGRTNSRSKKNKNKESNVVTFT